MKKWLALVLILVAGCSRPQAAERPVSVPPLPATETAPATQQAPAVPTRAPAPPTAPTPAASNSSQAQALDVDLNGDGSPEHVALEKDGLVRVSTAASQSVFTVQIPSKSRIKLQSYSWRGALPLVHISWPWCPRDYPDNVFLWYDPSAKTYRTDLNPDALAGRCGQYEYKGEGRFEAGFHYEAFYSTRSEHWAGDHLALDQTRVELLKVKPDQVALNLQRLFAYDVYNPEAWFEPPALYQEFKSRAKPDWSYEPLAEPDGKLIKLQVNAGGKSIGTLTLPYRIEDRLWVRITALRWEL